MSSILCFWVEIWATKASQTESVMDTVLLFVMTKPETRYMQHCCPSLMWSVLWSWSGPVVPQFSSCTGTSRGPKHSQHQDLLHIFPWVQSPPGTILLVVSTFVNFNTLSTICNIVLSLLNSPFVLCEQLCHSHCMLPTISPFLIMSRDSRISRLCFAEKEIQTPLPLGERCKWYVFGLCFLIHLLPSES